MDTERLQRLLDENDLRNLIQRMPWNLDHRDWDALPEVFTEDGVFEIGGQELRGHEAIAARPRQDLDKFYEATFHLMGQVHVDVDGDTARVVAYLVSYHIPKVSDPTTHEDVAGKYHCDAVRTDAGWRFKRMRLEFHWMAGPPFQVLQAAKHGAPPRSNQGE